MGEQAVKYLNKLAKSARHDKGKRNKTKFKKWQSIISVTLQRCNAKVVSNKLISIARLEHRNVVCSCTVILYASCRTVMVLLR